MSAMVRPFKRQQPAGRLFRGKALGDARLSWRFFSPRVPRRIGSAIVSTVMAFPSRPESRTSQSSPSKIGELCLTF